MLLDARLPLMWLLLWPCGILRLSGSHGGPRAQAEGC